MWLRARSSRSRGVLASWAGRFNIFPPDGYKIELPLDSDDELLNGGGLPLDSDDELLNGGGYPLAAKQKKRPTAAAAAAAAALPKKPVAAAAAASSMEPVAASGANTLPVALAKRFEVETSALRCVGGARARARAERAAIRDGACGYSSIRDAFATAVVIATVVITEYLYLVLTVTTLRETVPDPFGSSPGGCTWMRPSCAKPRYSRGMTGRTKRARGARCSAPSRPNSISCPTADCCCLHGEERRAITKGEGGVHRQIGTLAPRSREMRMVRFATATHRRHTLANDPLPFFPHPVTRVIFKPAVCCADPSFRGSSARTRSTRAGSASR